jgi:hypothetical protein
MRGRRFFKANHPFDTCRMFFISVTIINVKGAIRGHADTEDIEPSLGCVGVQAFFIFCFAKNHESTTDFPVVPVALLQHFHRRALLRSDSIFMAASATEATHNPQCGE